MKDRTNMVEMTVIRLDNDPKTNHEMVWLQSIEQDVVLPIVIGHTEFMAIYAELAGERTPRPLTHDLLRMILDYFDTRIEEVQIVDLKDGIFYAELVLSCEGELLRLDARPSDSIALALKYGAPLYMSEKVLKAAGIRINPKQAETLLEPLSARTGGVDSGVEVTEAVERLLVEAGFAGFASDGGENLEKRIDLLKKRMAWAIQKERYEEASQLRDEIAELEKSRQRK